MVLEGGFEFLDWCKAMLHNLLQQQKEAIAFLCFWDHIIHDLFIVGNQE